MTRQDREQQVQRLVELMQAVALQVRPDTIENWPEDVLTMTQLLILRLIHRGPLRMSDIADQIGSSYPAATSMIDRLVEKDLVERVHSTVDRRVVTCQLTPRGVEVLDSLWRVQRHHVLEIANVLTLDEIHTVIIALEILQDSQSRRSSDS